MTARELLTGEQVENIMNMKGADRNDLMIKVAEFLNTGFVNTIVYVKSTTKVTLNDYQIDLSTRKSKGEQIVKTIMVQSLKDYKDIKFYYR